MSFLTVSSSKRRPIRRLKNRQHVVFSIDSGVKSYLTSKTVFSGFIAAWFLAASPIRRSSEVKETNEGVVKLPCSLATGCALGRIVSAMRFRGRTDLDIGALVVGDTRVGGA